MALGPALFATKSYSHPEIGRAYTRARELCQQLGDHSRGFTVFRGLQIHHLNLLEMEKAQHFAEEVLRVAERLDDTARLIGAHGALGGVLYFQGKIEPALVHFRRGFEMFDPNMQFPDWPGSHPGVQCRCSPRSVSGSVHRAWVNIKSTITGMDEAAVLAECERGEDVARKAYEDALSKELPAAVRSMIERQYQGVRQHQDRVHQLRGAVS